MTHAPHSGQAAALGDIEIGVSLFDSEQRDIAAVVNRLCEESRTDGNAAFLHGRLKSLVNKLARHFAHEEEYMLHSGFPARKAHGEDHVRLMRILEQLVADLGCAALDGPSLGTKLEGFFQAMLPVHIAEHDRALGLYLNGKGLR